MIALDCRKHFSAIVSDHMETRLYYLCWDCDYFFFGETAILVSFPQKQLDSLECFQILQKTKQNIKHPTNLFASFSLPDLRTTYVAKKF